MTPTSRRILLVGLLVAAALPINSPDAHAHHTKSFTGCRWSRGLGECVETRPISQATA